VACCRKKDVLCVSTSYQVLAFVQLVFVNGVVMRALVGQGFGVWGSYRREHEADLRNSKGNTSVAACHGVAFLPFRVLSRVDLPLTKLTQNPQ
jgi:hypothetical protein